MRRHVRHDEILVSIHPKYAEAILDGKKSVEYRRTMPDIVARWNIRRMWIYETAPTKKIVGVADMCIRWGNVFDEQRGMLTLDEYLAYMGDMDGYAIHIVSVTRFNEPLSLAAIGLKRPPQSWMYMPTGVNPPAGTTVYIPW